MKYFREFIRIYNTKLVPSKPLLGRWSLGNNYIKTDLANHDCCGDRLCGDPRLTTSYISKNLIQRNGNKG